MDACWDVFVSYRRQGVLPEWTCRWFGVLLREHLEVAYPGARVFIDERNVETGAEIDGALKRAILGSRVIVPILSPGYPESRWCRVELGTFLAREARRPSPDLPSLIYPVLVQDGQHLPEVYRRWKWMDMKPYLRRFTPTLLGMPEQMRGEERIRDLADHIAEVLRVLPVDLPDDLALHEIQAEPRPSSSLPTW